MILLASPWTQSGLSESIKAAFHLPSSVRWPSAFAKRILKQFEPSGVLPTTWQLVNYLNRDELFWEKVGTYDLFEQFQPNLLSLPQARMNPGRGIPDTWDLPPLVTVGKLAEWLAVSPTRLDWLADCLNRERLHPTPKLRHYRYRWIPKRTNRYRLLEAPKPVLKTLQRQILDEILNRIPPHDASQAYCPKRSILTYAAPHVGQDVVLHLDLRHFFPSIRKAKIRALFRWAGYPERVSDLLSGLCTNSVPDSILDAHPLAFDVDLRQRLQNQLSSPHLPQGSPTSPALANLAAYRLDCRLAGLARKWNANYTRYADDLTFSGNRNFRRGLSKFRIAVCAIVLNEGFEIRHRKTRVMPKGTRQHIAGILVNRHPNISRKEYDDLRAILFNCIRNGPQSQNHRNHPHFKEHLAGRVAHQARINPHRKAKLARLFDQIQW